MKPVRGATELLKAFVAIPSVNPIFRMPDEDEAHFGEEHFAQYLQEVLGEMGFSVSLEEVLPGRHNVIAKKIRGHKHTIALQSHMDTVQVRGMTVAPFGEQRHDRLYGRGSADTKATAAVYIEALRSLIEDESLQADLCYFGTVDEEFGFSGARHAATRHHVDACIVGEPTGLRLVTTHNGLVRFELHTEGVAAHSATPEQGRNAILDMVRCLSSFQRFAKRNLQGREHPVTGSATWTPAIIRGGVGYNTVPSSCSVMIDARLVPGDATEEVLAEVDAWLASAENFDGSWSRSDVRVRNPPLVTSATTPLVQAFQSALRLQNLPIAPMGVRYATDACHFAAHGAQTLVFGPGSIAQAHTDDEWIDLNEVEAAVPLVAHAVRQLAIALRTS